MCAKNDSVIELVEYFSKAIPDYRKRKRQLDRIIIAYFNDYGIDFSDKVIIDIQNKAASLIQDNDRLYRYSIYALLVFLKNFNFELIPFNNNYNYRCIIKVGDRVIFDDCLFRLVSSLKYEKCSGLLLKAYSTAKDELIEDSYKNSYGK